MMQWFAALDQPVQVDVAALLGAAVVFIIGLLQYQKAQRWKRAEWLAVEMEAFFSDPVVKLALQIIDWETRRIELFPDREKREDRYLVVEDDCVASALQPHEKRPKGFTEAEAAIRDVFDHFLDRVERVQSFVAARLVTIGDVRPYLKYWAHQITQAREGDPNVDRLVQLRVYIARYRYEGVAWLLPRLAMLPLSRRRLFADR